MRFGVVLKWFGVVWCVLGWFGGVSTVRLQPLCTKKKEKVDTEYIHILSV